MIIAMPLNVSNYPDRVYMKEVTKELERNRSTVITWERSGWLPEGADFQRDSGGRRYWTREQLEQVRAWMNRPGRRRAPHSASNAA
jgi:hypothetical protein